MSVTSCVQGLAYAVCTLVNLSNLVLTSVSSEAYLRFEKYGGKHSWQARNASLSRGTVALLCGADEVSTIQTLILP